MHQLLARPPTIQARLVLLLEQFAIAELLCASTAFIGREGLDCLDKGNWWTKQQDDYGSNGWPDPANFLTSLTGPLESQERGFAHGRKKVNGVPSCRASAIKQMFQSSDAELTAFLKRLRDAVLQAASTIQYDAADLPATQLGVQVPSEPFSKKQ